MKENKFEGRLLVICGFSGSGKDTVAEIFKQEGWEMVVTHSAGRGPRAGEKHGVHHYFVSHEEFDGLVAKGEMLEHVHYAETKKGTSRREIEETLRMGKKLIWRIDPTAASRVGEILLQGFGPEAGAEIARRTRVVFLRAESEEVLFERARSRNKDEDPEIIKRRIREDALVWEKLADKFEKVVINRQGELERTVAEIRAMLEE